MLVLAELAGEIHQEIVPAAVENLGDATTCELCGIPSHRVEWTASDSRVEYYLEDEYPASCEGRHFIARAVVGTSGMLPVCMEEVIDFHCTARSNAGEDHFIGDALEREPIDVEEYDVPVTELVRTRIHHHHVSYEDPEVIRVCGSCHGRIHHNDSFRPDLQPDMSREQWESQENSDSTNALRADED